MELTCSTVDWSEVSQRNAARTLEADLMDVEGDEQWVCDVEDWNDSGYIWSSAGRIYDALAPHLSAANRVCGDESLRVLFSQKPIDDLGAQLEYYVHIWSPQRVRQLAVALSKLDYQDLEDAFDDHCPDDERDSFTDFEEFKAYCEQWRQVLHDAAEQGRGILCHCG